MNTVEDRTIHQAQNRDNEGRTAPQHRTNPWTFAVHIGFFAGLIWGLVKIFFYYFEFTKVEPAFFMSTWYVDRYLNTWTGHVVGLFWIVVGSIAAALVYTALFRKFPGPWPGVLYGLAWWAVLYTWVGPWTASFESLYTLDRNSFWTDLSIFVLWGVFIGYSISFEFTDEQSRDSSRQVLK